MTGSQFTPLSDYQPLFAAADRADVSLEGVNWPATAQPAATRMEDDLSQLPNQGVTAGLAVQLALVQIGLDDNELRLSLGIPGINDIFQLPGS